MAYDAYLKLDGIKGESNAANHQGETEILSYSLSASQSPGGGAHESVKEMSFVKVLDSISATLFQKCATGEYIASAVLTLDKRVGASSLTYATYTMTNVMVLSVRPGGYGKAEDKPLEEFTLGFEKIVWKYA